MKNLMNFCSNALATGVRFVVGVGMVGGLITVALVMGCQAESETAGDWNGYNNGPRGWRFNAAE